MDIRLEDAGVDALKAIFLIVLQLLPDFQEKNVGFKRFSDILKDLERRDVLKLEMDDQKNMLVKML